MTVRAPKTAMKAPKIGMKNTGKPGSPASGATMTSMKNARAPRRAAFPAPATVIAKDRPSCGPAL
jgi:hypothetical protein